jgi:molecular chaperone DnaK
VTFDIDANGIVHVMAKDMATNKEQSIRITASSGLSEEEIKQMVKDAELHADEDKKKRESIEARNQLDSLVYSTERTLKEYKGDLDPAARSAIESALERGKKAVESNDVAEIKAATEALSEASHRLAEAMYAQATKRGPGGDGGTAGAGGPETGGERPGKGGDDVVDADFEEVK